MVLPETELTLTKMVLLLLHLQQEVLEPRLSYFHKLMVPPPILHLVLNLLLYGLLLELQHNNSNGMREPQTLQH